MMLRIGSECRSFTLIEVMAATCVLAIGAVLVYESLFISLDTFNYYANYLNLLCLVDEKTCLAQDNLTNYANLDNIENSGEFIRRNKHFNWRLSYSQIDKIEDTHKLFKIDLVVSWKESRRDVSISRASYALYRKE